MGAFLGYDEVGVWASNRERDAFLDWFAAHRCSPGSPAWTFCNSEGNRWTGCCIELDNLIPRGTTFEVSAAEQAAAAADFWPEVGILLGIVAQITRGHWSHRVDSAPANYWRPGWNFLAAGRLVFLRRPAEGDRDEFVDLAETSRAFLRPWVDPPATRERFDAYLYSRQSGHDDGFVVCERSTARIAGVVNVNAIVRGAFQSAYLGYWVGEPFARRGYMTEAIGLVVRLAFGDLGLHRLEANVQPGNGPSIALVRRCGFEKEGFSPAYLRVFGQWRDHERWAIRAPGE